MLIVLKSFSDDKSAEKFTGSDGVIDYAKMTEKPSIRRRRFFSLGVVSFTAFIFNLSFSIILTSAKPYLDKVYSSNIITQYIAFEFKIKLKLKRIGITGRRRQRKATRLMSSSVVVAGRRNKTVTTGGGGGGGADEMMQAIERPVADECDCVS